MAVAIFGGVDYYSGLVARWVLILAVVVLVAALIAQYAQTILALLASVLIFVAIIRIAWPSRRY